MRSAPRLLPPGPPPGCVSAGSYSSRMAGPSSGPEPGTPRSTCSPYNSGCPRRGGHWPASGTAQHGTTAPFALPDWRAVLRWMRPHWEPAPRPKSPQRTTGGCWAAADIGAAPCGRWWRWTGTGQGRLCASLWVTPLKDGPGSEELAHGAPAALKREKSLELPSWGKQTQEHKWGFQRRSGAYKAICRCQPAFIVNISVWDDSLVCSMDEKNILGSASPHLLKLYINRTVNTNVL